MKINKEYILSFVMIICLSYILYLIFAINFNNCFNLFYYICEGLTIFAIFDIYFNIKLDKKFNLRKKCGFREDYNPFNKFQLKTNIENYLISTIDLGINMNFGKGKPLYYETMIIDKTKDTFIDYQVRYSSKKEAIKGHETAVKYIIKKLNKIKD